MKIERLSDNQIRCTLNKQDLQERKLQLSELFYGSDKAKELFRDLMQMASYECGFETEDLPLMIEAIPVNPDCLVLVVTKVEDTDELDSRFSNFTPGKDKDTTPQAPAAPALADEILNYFSQVKELLHQKAAKLSKEAGVSEESIETATPYFKKTYCFSSLNEVCRFASVVLPNYRGEVTLYKDPAEGVYYLLLDMKGHSAEEFNKLCNIASEYSQPIPTTPATYRFFEEHFTPVNTEHLLETLAKLA